MIYSNDPENAPPNTTRNPSAVDRGDDLLASNREAPKVAVESADEQLHSAQILMAEGFTDEAKHLLRRILIADPHFVPARVTLDEIHARELKMIFAQDPPTPARHTQESSDLHPLDALESLEEFALVAELEDGPARRIFPDAESIERFGQSLERSMQDASHQDRIDLGIGFMEMGLTELAIAQFERARKQLISAWIHEVGTAGDATMSESLQVQLISAGCLAASAYLRIGKAFESSVVLQELLRDASLEGVLKKDVVYLLGRGAEQLGRRKEALEWYAQALKLEPGYRDAEARMARLTEK